MRILVKGTNWLGDAVMSLPTLRSLREMYPKASITILTKRAFADLYQGAPYVDEILPYDKNRGAGRVTGGMKLAKSLKRQKFDVAILLPRSFSSAMLTFTARIPKRIGYGGEGRTAFLTDAMKREKSLLAKHRVHYYHNLLTALGKPPSARAPHLDIPAEARAWAKDQLPHGKPLVAINPGATYGNAKQWFPGRFAEVGRKLIKKHDARIVTVGGPSERGVAEEVLQKIGDGRQLAGKTDILQLAAVLGQADLLLTNDTGPMHVADAVGTPVVAIFGPTDPVTTPPYGSKNTLVRKEIECSPCLKRECPLEHHNCMKWIKPDEVYAACRTWLKSRRR